jgi:integrase
VGWKDLLLEDAKRQCAFVHFFPEEWGVLFYTLYTVYVTRVRPAKLDHPYLFVSGPKGEYAPLSRGAYAESLERAVRRIGLESLRENGSTSHGLRHAYGQTLDELGVPAKYIQIMMHHKSVLSQEPYTRKTAQHLQAAIDEARKLIATKGTGLGRISPTNILPPPGALIP